MFGKRNEETNGSVQNKLIFETKGDQVVFEDNIIRWMKVVDAYPWCNRQSTVDKNIMTYEFIEKQIVSLLRQVTGYSDEYTFQFTTYTSYFPNFEVFGRIQKGEEYVEPLHVVFKNTGYHQDPLFLLVMKSGKTYHYSVKPVFNGGNPLSSSWISASLEQYEKKDIYGNRNINCSSFVGDYYFIHFRCADELVVVQINYPEAVKHDQKNGYIDIDVFEDKLLHSDEATSGKITDIYKMLCLALKGDLEDYPKIIVKRYKVLENEDKELLENIETQYGNHKDIRLMDDTKVISVYSDNAWSHQTDTVTWAENSKGISHTVQAKNIYEINKSAGLKEEYDAAVKDVTEAIQLLKTIEKGK